MRSPLLFGCLALVAATLPAQVRHDLEFAATGVFPLSGNKTNGYSAGPGWRAGYEVRPWKHLGADAGFTEAWPSGVVTCTRFGCEYAREPLKLLDYGVRGVASPRGGRVELSAGMGGGYVWHDYPYFGQNEALFQYSGKASIALDRSRRWRAGFTIRAWRDLGRPTQQWLSSSGGITLSLGHP